ncbi:MAG: hypothetical protein N3B13_10135, partial [Deltaproteobacteria bacterium]|nr:hypothetical protein [Deltaproteobacteria bacterium]
PYGRAIIVSPLLSTDKKITDGAEYYPDYIPKEVRDQREVAMANGVRFWYLDEFERNFIKEVLNK